MDEKVQEILGSLDTSSLRNVPGQFAAKLTFDERCSILAAYLSGVNRRVLAVAFGINRRTVTHIYNSRSPHYKDIKNELQRIGKDRFVDRYLTEDVAMRIKKTEANREAQVVFDLTDREADIRTFGALTPSKRRKTHAGVHTIKPEWCAYSHRVLIDWVTGYFGDGWYYQDLDGSFPEEWLHSGEESIISSTAALKGAEENVTDKL